MEETVYNHRQIRLRCSSALGVASLSVFLIWRFDVEVRVEDIVLGRGQGRSKKSAEQAAARMALINHRSNEKTS